MEIKEVLDRAGDVVLSQRQKEYSQQSVTQMHIQIAQVWSGILDRDVTAHEVALCMAGLKLVRASCQPGHEDSYVDAVGYAAIAAEILHEEEKDMYMHPAFGKAMRVHTGEESEDE